MASLTVVVTTLKGIGSGFSIIICLVALVYLLYSKFYRQLLQRLFVALLVTSTLFSFSILFETLAVNTTALTQGTNNSDIRRQQLLCTVSGVLFHYSTWVDILVISVIAIWLTRITAKTKRFSTVIDKEEYKKRIRQKYWEALGFTTIFLFPVLPVLLPLGVVKYEVNDGKWCRIQIEIYDSNDTMHLDNGALSISLILWYIPVFVIMIFVTVILTIANIKLCKKLRKSTRVLKGSHSDVLKDGIALSVFLMIIYSTYGINIFTALFYLIYDKPDIPLGIIEALATVVRGVAILCMFFNKRMCRKIYKGKDTPPMNSLKMMQKIFDDKYNNHNTESLIATPSIATDAEYDIIEVERGMNTDRARLLL